MSEERKALEVCTPLHQAALNTIAPSDWTATDTALLQKVEALKAQGWEAHPCTCAMCGGGCGLLAMHKKGTAPSRQTVRILPNPTHPQRGCCARAASAMWVWDSPLRLKKPLKRVGARCEGKFEEITWDQALDEIAAKVRHIVTQHGEHAVSMTSHNHTDFQKWFGFALGTPNVISHASTCNSASVAGRRMVFGKGFDGPGKVEPDYARCRYLLCVGRSLNCTMGVAAVVARARQAGAQVLFVDPRMPEGALSNDQWIAIRPGTDSAFLLSLMHVAMRENLVDFEFLSKYTNAPYLVDSATLRPIAADEIFSDAPKGAWLTIDSTTKKPAVMSTLKNEKGVVTAFVEPEGLNADLTYEGELKTVNGTRLQVKTVYNAFKASADEWTPEKASFVTGIAAEVIVRTARDFFTLGGVADDGWYGSRNGNDTDAFALLSLMNVFAGNLDKKGGFVVTQGAGFKAPGVSLSGATASGPNGQQWTIPDSKPLDKRYYPEGGGTYSAIFDAIETGTPYPIRAAFITGTTMFHREANTPRMEKAFKALDLMVVQDIFPHEVCDWADYVLPCTYFLERCEYGGVKWSLHGNIHKNDAGITPPEGCQAREEIWQYCEILRRAFPDRAKDRLGYDKELKSREEFHNWFEAMSDKAWNKFIAKKNSDMPGAGDKIATDISVQGWSQTAVKEFGVYPYKKPFGTVTGKAELLSFMFKVKYAEIGIDGLPKWRPVPGYTHPKPLSDEFYLVSGKDSASSSGTCTFTLPQATLGDRTLWMHPTDAQRLGIRQGDTVLVTGMDTGVKARTQITVTRRVMPGTLFAYGFSGGVRTKTLIPKDYEWVREGINTNQLCTGYREPVVGALANNCSVRIQRIQQQGH